MSWHLCRMEVTTRRTNGLPHPVSHYCLLCKYPPQWVTPHCWRTCHVENLYFSSQQVFNAATAAELSRARKLLFRCPVTSQGCLVETRHSGSHGDLTLTRPILSERFTPCVCSARLLSRLLRGFPPQAWRQRPASLVLALMSQSSEGPCSHLTSLVLTSWHAEEGGPIGRAAHRTSKTWPLVDPSARLCSYEPSRHGSKGRPGA
jgi:hypothetical protein